MVCWAEGNAQVRCLHSELPSSPPAMLPDWETQVKDSSLVKTHLLSIPLDPNIWVSQNVYTIDLIAGSTFPLINVSPPPPFFSLVPFEGERADMLQSYLVNLAPLPVPLQCLGSIFFSGLSICTPLAIYLCNIGFKPILTSTSAVFLGVFQASHTSLKSRLLLGFFIFAIQVFW